MRARGCGATLLGAFLLIATDLAAQTWEGDRTTPELDEAIVVDATGELGWPYGTEDVAGDGTAFGDVEQSVDVRSVYVARGTGQLWTRLYVSSTDLPAAELTAYVFVNADRNTATGGPAEATTVDPALDDDPSPGGYEFLIVIPADDTRGSVWEWDGDEWQDTNVPASQIATEAEIDADPLRVGASRHGYVQAVVDYGTAGLNASCTADFYFRSSAGDAVPSAGDLEVGEEMACIPEDDNHNGTPDIVEPSGCTSEDDCPGDTICVENECVLPVECTTDNDCTGNDICDNGVCREAIQCTRDEDCETLVCEGGVCVSCTTDDDCSSGVCASNGRCEPNDQSPGAAGSGGIRLDPGDEVRGGACTCTLPGQRPTSHAWWAAAAVVAALWRRRQHP